MKAIYKRNPDFTAWDLNASSRKYVDQSTPARRCLKRKLRRIARKRISKILPETY